MLNTYTLPASLLFALNHAAADEDDGASDLATLTAAELADRMCSLQERMRSIASNAESASRELTSKETRRLDRLQIEFDDARDRYREIEQPQNSARWMSRAAEAAANHAQTPRAITQQIDLGALSNRTPATNAQLRELPPGATGRRFSDLFSNRSATDLGGFKTLDEFVNAIAYRQSHPALQPFVNAVHSEGTGADGGFMVPPQFLAGILDNALESELVRPRARVVAMRGPSLMLPGVEASDRRVSIGGLVGQWLGEGATMNPQKATFRLVTLKANKLGVLCEASNELAADGVGFASQLSTAMEQATSYSLDQGFLSGSGAGQPLGLLHSDTTIVVSPESGQTADTIRFENIVNMRARLHPACWRNAVWHVTPEALPQLMTMKFPGSDPATPVWLPANQIAGQPFDMLLGRPLIVTEKAELLGDRGDLVLADWSQYAIGLRMSASLQMSEHAGFARDSVQWRLILRVGGQPLWSAAVTPANGGPTLSWAVVLGERA